MDKPGLPLRTLNGDLFPARERERSRSMPQEAGPVAEGAVQSTGRTFTTSCDRWNAFSAFKTPLNFLLFLPRPGSKSPGIFLPRLKNQSVAFISSCLGWPGFDRRRSAPTFHQLI